MIDPADVPSTRGERLPSRLDAPNAIGLHLEALTALDPRLAAVAAVAGEIAPRTAERGFIGLARAVCGQQLSVASARAIWTRFEGLPGVREPERFLRLDEAEIRATGFSGGKYRTVRAIAEAVVAGTLDLAHAERLPAPEAVRYLSAHKGVGPWTAELYLLFSAGHPDVFPAGDLALGKAVAHAFGLAERPTIKQLVEVAAGWAPHRGVAALLFWRYFAAIKHRDGTI